MRNASFLFSNSFPHLFFLGLYSGLLKVKVKVKLTQLCLTLCNPTDCSLPGFSVHGISHARILEWVAISFSRDLPNPGMEPRSPLLQVDSLLSEPPTNPLRDHLISYLQMHITYIYYVTSYLLHSETRKAYNGK